MDKIIDILCTAAILAAGYSLLWMLIHDAYLSAGIGASFGVALFVSPLIGFCVYSTARLFARIHREEG